ncbi:MAG: C2 family cysteine protease [Roseiarcus sp.]|jgi:hypothetical protein
MSASNSFSQTFRTLNFRHSQAPTIDGSDSFDAAGSDIPGAPDGDSYNLSLLIVPPNPTPGSDGSEQPSLFFGGAKLTPGAGSSASGSNPSSGSSVSSGTPTTSASTPASTILAKLSNAGIEADVAKLMVNDSLSYSSMLTILQDAAVGGMTASKFSTLQTLASLLNASGGISTSAYVQQITQDVVDGNSANATWNGGSSTATKLGNLSATSTQTQATELIGMWFLGTNLPSMSVSSIGEANYNPTYQATTEPLYGTSGAPVYTDVNQGYLGDCYFMSALADVALQDPSVIENMITSDGNGAYSVEFVVDGRPDYVTVNDELPTMQKGYSWANGSTLEFANGSPEWAELVEKAYAELNAQTAAPHGEELNQASDSYAGIDAGSGYALTEITGQAVDDYSFTSKTAASTFSADNSLFAADWSSGEEMLVGTSNIASGNIVSDHMYEVIGYTAGTSAATDMLTLHNPWGSAYSGPLAMTFSISLATLAADDVTIFATIGKATV